MASNAIRALDPIWLRFTDPEDVEKYGDRWFKYDEGAILRLRADKLIALETDLGMPLVSLMNGFRGNSALGDTAAAWLAVRSVNFSLAGDFDTFTPVTMAIEWTGSDPEPAPKEESPEPMPPPVDSSSQTSASSPNTTSETTDTVVLQSLPLAES